MDIVSEIAYSLPVAVICRLLGVPAADQSRFQFWSAGIARDTDGISHLSPSEVEAARCSGLQLNDYVAEFAAAPRDEFISRLVAGTPSLAGIELTWTFRLLLVAGHETTVNLITHCMLTTLRHPGTVERLRAEPELACVWSRRSCATNPPCASAPGSPSTTSPSAV